MKIQKIVNQYHHLKTNSNLMVLPHHQTLNPVLFLNVVKKAVKNIVLDF